MRAGCHIPVDCVEFGPFQNVAVPTDDAFVTAVASYIRKCASGITGKSHMYVETAGGET
jgi:hypothetical protein